MHILKLHSEDIRGVLAEHARQPGYHSKYGDIDQARTALNYNLAPRDISTAEGVTAYIKELGVTRKIRENAVLALNCIATMPQDCTAGVDEWARATYDGLVKELCLGHEELVIQCYIHLDEMTPHINFAYTPVLYDEDREKVQKPTKNRPKDADRGNKRGKYKTSHAPRLTADEMCNKLTLQQLHPAIQEYLQERGIDGTMHLPEKAKDPNWKNESIERYKAHKERDKQIQSQQETIREQTYQIGAQQNTIFAQKKAYKKKLERMDAVIETKYAEIAAADEKAAEAIRRAETAEAQAYEEATHLHELQRNIHIAEQKLKKSHDKLKAAVQTDQGRQITQSVLEWVEQEHGLHLDYDQYYAWMEQSAEGALDASDIWNR